MIEIQHGCEKVQNTYNTYIYHDVSVRGYQEDYQSLMEVTSTDTMYLFVTNNGEEPEIGDFIVDGVLVKRTTPKVNNDWSKWKDKEL